MQSSKRRAGSSRRVRATWTVLARDEEGDLAPVDDGLLEGVRGEQVLLLQGPFELVGDLVEPAAVRPRGGARKAHRADESPVAGGVTAVVRAEHALAYADDLTGVLARDGYLAAVAVGFVAHRSSPFISIRGSALSAASSASRAASSALTPSLEPWIFWWSLRIASISISGRGGHPGK